MSFTTQSQVVARRVLRRPEVEARTGLSYTTLWRQYRAGRFPSPVKLSPGAVGWFEDEISAWLEARSADRVQRDVA